MAATKEESPLEEQTQWLKIGNETQDDDDDAFLEEAIKLAAAEKKELKAEKEKAAKILMAQQCTHGCDPLPENSDCVGFVNTFLAEYNARLDRGEHPLSATSNTGKAAIEKYPNATENSAKVGWILSRFLANGTKNIAGSSQRFHRNFL